MTVDDADCETGAATHQPAAPETHSRRNNNAALRTPDEQLKEQQRLATEEAIAKLEPPYANSEKFRDGLLRILDGPFFQYLGLLVLFLVVVDGAFFFFLLMGWHAMCDDPKRTDCDPRNWWYNFAVQFLVALFTYMNVFAMPWRCTQLLHIYGWSSPQRNNDVGHDLYGFRSKDIWYHLPLGARGGITLSLFTSSITQFFNQASRIVFYNYELQDTSPGNIWVNVFFVSSMLSAGVGGAWLIVEETKIRKSHPPGTFPPGLLEIVGPLLGCNKKNQAEAEMNRANAEAEAIGDDDDEGDDGTIEPDPTRNRTWRSVTPASRPTMRLFAM